MIGLAQPVGLRKPDRSDCCTGSMDSEPFCRTFQHTGVLNQHKAPHRYCNMARHRGLYSLLPSGKACKLRRIVRLDRRRRKGSGKELSRRYTTLAICIMRSSAGSPQDGVDHIAYLAMILKLFAARPWTRLCLIFGNLLSVPLGWPL